MLHSSDFSINQNQLTAAVTEECMSVNADFNASLDDDLEADLYKECQSCSLTTTGGGSQQSKRQGLMIINQCSRKCIQRHLFSSPSPRYSMPCIHVGGSATVILSSLMVLIIPFINLIVLY